MATEVLGKKDSSHCASPGASIIIAMSVPIPIPCADWWRVGVGRMWGLAREDVDWSVPVERRGGWNFARRLDAPEVLGCGRLGCFFSPGILTMWSTLYLPFYLPIRGH